MPESRRFIATPEITYDIPTFTEHFVLRLVCLQSWKIISILCKNLQQDQKDKDYMCSRDIQDEGHQWGSIPEPFGLQVQCFTIMMRHYTLSLSVCWLVWYEFPDTHKQTLINKTKVTKSRRHDITYYIT